jgi:hypothetical protein
MAEGKVLVAATSATFDFEGKRVWLQQGRTTAREGHPVTRGREHLWKPLAVDFETEAPKAPAAKGQQAAQSRSGQKTA